ncbi:hypothetical protein [Aliiroseovarius sp. 2305UL8-7]|uniref:hypothetical protein n=1 Tax=Aliiroseovarius conchicola TaxID=3121637 RepID=UPI00352966B6
MLRKTLLSLSATVVWAFSGSNVFAQPSLSVEKLMYCGTDGGECLRRVDLILIDPEHFRTSVTSAAKRETSKEGGARVFFDNLLNYATSSDALAVVSGGFIRHINPLTPLGGLKTSGELISDLHNGWQDSSIICTDDDRVQITRDLGAFEVNQTCLQSGPTLVDGDKTAADLRAELGTSWPEDFWTRLTQRVAMVNFNDGSAGFVIGHNHNYDELHAFLKTHAFGDRSPVIAVGLNGGQWSGYIVRTPTDPEIFGDIDFVFPSVFLIRPRE